MELTYTFMLSLLERKFISYSKERLKEVNLNLGQIPFILYIGKYPSCTQASLTKTIKMDFGHSSRTITKLVDSSLVTKEVLEDKSCHLNLTSKGEEAYHLIKSLFRDYDKEILKDFSDEEKEVLRNLLLKIIKS